MGAQSGSSVKGPILEMSDKHVISTNIFLVSANYYCSMMGRASFHAGFSFMQRLRDSLTPGALIWWAPGSYRTDPSVRCTLMNG